jgi:glutaminyl-peptide cyclotransferase
MSDRYKFFGVIIGIVLISIAIWITFTHLFSPQPLFNGQRAYEDVVYQVELGPRTPGSVAHAQEVAYIVKVLKKAGWVVDFQDTYWLGFPIRNIIATRGDEASPIIIGAHYDSRIFADQDTGPASSEAVPGANDGASGVAILLELARCLPANTTPVWLVFFDAEDNGGIDGRDWIMGSRAFVNSLTVQPEAVIIVDMVGDMDLNLYQEQNSDPYLSGEIWAQAVELGYGEAFIETAKYSMLDDHTPFLDAGIPAVDIIDFDYPYWHKTTDTADKVSPESLTIVGETLRVWISGLK